MKTKMLRKALVSRAEEALVSKLPVDEKALRRVGNLMEPKNIKRAAIAVVGGSAALSLLGNIWETHVYRRAMAKELKKQLEPIKKQLSAIEVQNAELKKQNEQLRKRLSELEGHGFRR